MDCVVKDQLVVADASRLDRVVVAVVKNEADVDTG